MRTALLSLAGLCVFASALPAHAEYVTGRHVVSIGCHQVNGVCYAELDGAPFGGAEGCATGATNQIRWDDADTPNGRRTYASLLAVFLQQKSVDVSVTGCSSQGFPSLNYYTIRN